jgi:hypothetical protein
MFDFAQAHPERVKGVEGWEKYKEEARKAGT